ncbi:hypothetical protein LMH87_005293 [Akanthomyces muscarius]|uniref:Rhodanese domain-containing protein n=1 Tax=Akanthomyces muscarius TaxID=2231603 RepID=A0A9W8QNJ4_AKAMU|nr:hypothetical protein LMH87_005293 [Akanthomyces muscarius]KAJ4163572.1 hypothetical protein LMH87_005293 [Akanthomyces muscarius]
MAPSMPTEAPWHAAFPTPRNAQPGCITRETLLGKLKHDAGDGVAKRFLLVDLRRTDYEGGTIRGSINLPAQSLYPTIPTLHSLFKAAGLTTIIWYCGSSRGRGTRAACWFQDHLDDCGDKEMQSLILTEGVKGWATAGAEYADQMSGYNAQYWESH